MLFYYVLVDMSPLDTSSMVSNENKVTPAGPQRGTPGNRLEGGDREAETALSLFSFYNELMF